MTENDRPSEEQMEEVYRQMPHLKGEDKMSIDDARTLLGIVGVSVPGHEIRRLLKIEVAKREVTLDEIFSIYAQRMHEEGQKEIKKKLLKTSEDIKAYKTDNEISRAGEAKHSISKEEEKGFTRWINQMLGTDKDLVDANLLPINTEIDGQLYERLIDGRLLCKMINSAVPGTIDERSINKISANTLIFKSNENLTLAINSAAAIGCSTVNIGPGDISSKIQHLALGLIWQLIRKKLIDSINLEHHAELMALFPEGTDPSELLKYSPEELLIMWVNHHLEKAGISRRIKNFYTDLHDSEVYSTLVDQIVPDDKRPSIKSSVDILRTSDLDKRANDVIHNTTVVMKVPKILTASDIYNSDKNSREAHERMHTAFIASLFNMYPGLEAKPDMGNHYEETLEEKTYRNWMNSLGVQPHVNHLYTDLPNGLVLLQLIDHVKPNTVYQSKIVKKFDKNKEHFQKRANCDLFVETVKSIKIGMVNISGSDIYEGNKKLILGSCFRLMHAYTMNLLKQAHSGDHPDPLTWANSQLKEAGAEEIKGFGDTKLASGVPVLQILEKIRPGSTEKEIWKSVDTSKPNHDICVYAISSCRKAGARVYALPEHLERLETKLIQTVIILLQALASG